MSFVIDGRHLNGKIAGVQRLIHEVLLELDKRAKPGEYEILVPPNTIDLPAYNNISIKNMAASTVYFGNKFVCLGIYLHERSMAFSFAPLSLIVILEVS